MNLKQKINSVSDRKWQAFTTTVQIIFTVAIIVFVVVAFQTQSQVAEFKERVRKGNCSGIVFDNKTGEDERLPELRVNQSERVGVKGGDPPT